MASSSSFAELPRDSQLAIFEYLNSDDRERCQLVSKAWKDYAWKTIKRVVVTSEHASRAVDIFQRLTHRCKSIQLRPTARDSFTTITRAMKLIGEAANALNMNIEEFQVDCPQPKPLDNQNVPDMTAGLLALERSLRTLTIPISWCNCLPTLSQLRCLKIIQQRMRVRYIQLVLDAPRLQEIVYASTQPSPSIIKSMKELKRFPDLRCFDTTILYYLDIEAFSDICQLLEISESLVMVRFHVPRLQILALHNFVANSTAAVQRKFFNCRIIWNDHSWTPFEVCNFWGGDPSSIWTLLSLPSIESSMLLQNVGSYPIQSELRAAIMKRITSDSTLVKSINSRYIIQIINTGGLNSDARALIEGGASIGDQPNDSPLFALLLYRSGDIDSIEYLMAKGANSKFVGANGGSIAARALGNAAQFTLMHDKGWLDLHNATPRRGTVFHSYLNPASMVYPQVSSGTLRMVVDPNIGGVSINALDMDGNNALHAAFLCLPAASGLHPVLFRRVRQLIELGIDTNHRNNVGETPLWVAFKHPTFSRRIVKLLIGIGADITSREVFSGASIVEYLITRHHNKGLVALLQAALPLPNGLDLWLEAIRLAHVKNDRNAARTLIHFVGVTPGASKLLQMKLDDLGMTICELFIRWCFMYRLGMAPCRIAVENLQFNPSLHSSMIKGWVLQDDKDVIFQSYLFEFYAKAKTIFSLTDPTLPLVFVENARVYNPSSPRSLDQFFKAWSFLTTQVIVLGETQHTDLMNAIRQIESPAIQRLFVVSPPKK